MSADEAKIVHAAMAWALAVAQLEETMERDEAELDALGSAELAIYSAGARVEALKAAERAPLSAIQPSVLR
jgi:hypothetical protein